MLLELMLILINAINCNVKKRLVDENKCIYSTIDFGTEYLLNEEMIRVLEKINIQNVIGALLYIEIVYEKEVQNTTKKCNEYYNWRNLFDEDCDISRRVLCRYKYDLFGNVTGLVENVSNMFGFAGEMLEFFCRLI